MAHHSVLYGMKGSTCTRKVLTAFEETGAPFEFKVVSLMKGEHKAPEHLARHPMGRIPVLIEGDFRLYESGAILRYIAQTHDKSGHFYPHNPKERALAEQFSSFYTSYFPVDELVGELYFGKMYGKSANVEKVAADDAKLHTALVVLDAHLATHKHLAGEHFTYADVLYLPYLWYLTTKVPEYEHVLDKYTNVKRWWAEITNRPSWKKVASESEF